MWFAYVLLSEKTGRMYVGISKDPERRLLAHNGLIKGGAKSTRGFRPWKILHIIEAGLEKGIAQTLEFRIKSLKKNEKLSTHSIKILREAVHTEFIANRNVLAEKILRHLQKNEGVSSLVDLSKEFGNQIRPALNHLADSNHIEIKNEEVHLK